MVKGFVGTMLKIAMGKISLDEFISIINNNNNKSTDFSIPAQGLF